LKRTITYYLIMMLLLFPVKLWAESELSRNFIEERLVNKGMDKFQIQSMINDSRISTQPEIIILNLFYSTPRGAEKQPEIMGVDPKSVEKGRIFIKENKESLSSLNKRFGTSPQIITAILIVESKLGNYPMRYNVVTAYINLAFLLDPAYLGEIQKKYAGEYPLLNDEDTIKRAQNKAQWALDELYHLVNLANELKMDPLSIMGSFAGAIGPAQFIPSTFRIYGIDGDGDGIRNPFNMADAKASIGNYLKSSGWSEDATLEIKRKAIWQYNHSQVYVNTIILLYDELRQQKKDEISPESLLRRQKQDKISSESFLF
jgi:membrane-bound lytic murein transglycosylase B